MFGRKKRPAYVQNIYWNQEQNGYPYYPFGNIHDVSRQQMLPYQMVNQQSHWNPYFNQQPANYTMNAFLQQQYGNPNYYGNPYNSQANYSQSIFQNPLQPPEESYIPPYSQQMNPFQSANPYPKASFMGKQPSGLQSVMNSFKSQDGTIDFNKMMNTAGQMMNAVNQVSSMVKGLGGMFKV